MRCGVKYAHSITLASVQSLLRGAGRPWGNPGGFPAPRATFGFIKMHPVRLGVPGPASGVDIYCEMGRESILPALAIRTHLISVRGRPEKRATPR